MRDRSGAAPGDGRVNAHELATDGEFPAVTAGPWHVQTIVSDNEWRQNGYLVEYRPTAQLVVIDPGGSPAQYLATLGDRIAQVSHILLTHAHHDHVGAVAALSSATGLPCVLHRGDGRLLRQAAMYGLRFGGRVIATPRDVAYFDAPAVSVGGDEIRVIDIPGHTAGSVAFIAGTLMFSGDTLLFEKVGRTDLPGGNAEQLRDSVGALVNHAGDTVLLPGHGKSWTIGEARTWWEGVRSAPPSHLTFEP